MMDAVACTWQAVVIEVLALTERWQHDTGLVIMKKEAAIDQVLSAIEKGMT